MPCSPDSDPPSSTHSSAICAGQLLGALGLARRRRCRAPAGAGCRRRRGRRWPPAARPRRPSRRSGRAPRPAGCAAPRRPARSSPGRSGRPRRTRPCGPARSPPAPRREPAMCSRVQPCSSQICLTCSNWASHSSAGPSSSTTSAAGTPTRVAGVHGLLGRLDGERVHHLDRGGHDAGGHDVADDVARGPDRREVGEQRAHRLRGAQQPHGDLRGDARACPRSRGTPRAGPGPTCSPVSRAERDAPSRRAARPRPDSTWLVVKPYLRQCAPPEFSATLPPIVQTCWLDGSGA